MCDKLIYLDNAATTVVKPEVIDAMKPYFTENYGNPSSVYQFAGMAKKAVDEARGIMASAIGARDDEIYFTSGGTESDNWAIKATAESYSFKGNHIITTKIEHHAVIHTCQYLETKGYEVTYLNVDENGKIRLRELEKAIKDTTILISIMTANNEIGTIQPIKEIGQIANKKQILFHTDAVQAFGRVPIDVKDMNIDMLSASGHKLHGPKGIGIMYIRKGVNISSFLHGGSQEHKRRAGTYNVPGIVGMAKATEIACKEMNQVNTREVVLRDYLINRVLKEVPYTRLNGHRKDRLPNNVNFSFQFIDGEAILIMLDTKGICASSGSACTTGSTNPSHVLMALGLPSEIAHGSLRITLSEDTTKDELDYVIENIKESVEKLRSMSTIYEEFVLKNGKKNK